MYKYKSISEAWWFNLKHCFEEGEDVLIDRGSYEKELTRRQLKKLSFEIEFPLRDMIPILNSNLPQVVTAEDGERYFREKIIGDVKSENEEYTYGERILVQLEKVIQILIETPFTNQADISISRPEDIDLPDPPCLRNISFRMSRDYTLNMHLFFRSWDLYAALAMNLYGLARLQEYVCGFLEGVNIGRLYAYSSGAHIYSSVFDIVKAIISYE